MSLLLPCLLVVGVARQLWSPSRHCLSLTISPPRALFVISLTHLFTQLFLLVIGVFSSALTVLFLLTCQFPSPSPLPGLPPLSFPPARVLLVNRTRERSRNRAGCHLDERGHAGPADLVVLSHRKAPPSVCRSHARTKCVRSNLTLRTLLTASCNSDVKEFLRTVTKTVPPYQTQV